jgi:hypothetical protein
VLQGLFAADYIENVELGSSSAIISDFKWLAVPFHHFKFVCQLCNRSFLHQRASLFALHLLLNAFTMRDEIWFEDAVLPSIEILYEIFILQLIVTFDIFKALPQNIFRPDGQLRATILQVSPFFRNDGIFLNEISLFCM